MERKFKGRAPPENVGAVQAAVYRLEALNGAITVKQHKGSKPHTWISERGIAGQYNGQKNLTDTEAGGRGAVRWQPGHAFGCEGSCAETAFGV